MNGAATTFGGNPSFTVFEMDEEFMLPLNFHTIYNNLTETNRVGTPKWEELHDFVQHYGISDVSPDSLDVLASNILLNTKLASQYMWNRRKRADPTSPYCVDHC
jgi:sphingomyelin phosphodiesterase